MQRCAEYSGNPLGKKSCGLHFSSAEAPKEAVIDTKAKDWSQNFLLLRT